MEEYRFATLRGLKTINRHSMKKGFNRTISWTKYRKGMRRVCAENALAFHDDLLIPLVPLMFHEHKGGRSCEKHIRTLTQVGDVSVFLDMTIRDFESLRLREDVEKKAA
jgi:hypothetical protein|tara:strand:+ start:170 stop:496 length:327 start_codon:yes stop_codon:yes gene_type:complete